MAYDLDFIIYTYLTLIYSFSALGNLVCFGPNVLDKHKIGPNEVQLYYEQGVIDVELTIIPNPEVFFNLQHCLDLSVND